MARTKYFPFILSNGTIKVMSFSEALEMKDDPAVLKELREISSAYRNRKTKKDGFQPGMQDSILEPFTCKHAYERRVKELNCHIMDPSEQLKEQVYEPNMLTDEFFKTTIGEKGAEISGQEVEALRAGKRFASNLTEEEKGLKLEGITQI